MPAKDELFGTKLACFNETNPSVLFDVFFDSIYKGDAKYFIRCLACLVKKNGISVEWTHCEFPDINSFETTDHFEGVRVSAGNPMDGFDIPTAYVSEDFFYDCLHSACEKFIERHPECKDKVNDVLALNSAIEKVI